ncbi:hypothetical protein MMC25_000950 [Agyrium rufum]|nr:hypothetical protein [Agyrium rufum]
MFFSIAEDYELTNPVQRRSATLHALHRAIITSSEPIPDTFFSLSINDLPANNTWTLARPGDPRHYPGAPNNGDTSKPIEDWKPVGNYWPMPHYSSWSWGMPYIGTLDEALSRIERIEAKHPKWSDKIPKAIWRGTEGFNPMWNTQLRPSLVRLARDKPWADVEPLHNSNPRVKNNNVVSIEDFCRWRYIIYTEGITYSGRLPYHQACASVLITPPLHYLTHNTHLIKPMYASRVLELSAKDKESSELHPAFPVSYSPNEANTVFVQHDWSDLEDVIEWLEGRPEIGESIARNQQRLMVEGGYLTQAADACYWRSLIQAWALRVEVPKNEGYWTSGTRWETWVLDGK